MIPAAFDYVRCQDLDEAVAALARHGDEAKLLAGGHSLVPVLKLRLNAPALLVDLRSVPELAGIRIREDELVVGAMTTYQQIIDSPAVNAWAPVLAQACGTIADPQVRHRGTIGGSLAHADPAGDLGAVAVALDCDLVLAGPRGRRRVAADGFFVDHFESVLDEDEVLVEVVVPRWPAGTGGWYEKFNRASHMWAIVGTCALVVEADGRVAEVRVAHTNMGSTPVRAQATEEALRGKPMTAIAAASELADRGTAPPDDSQGSARYRRHLSRVLTGRALARAVDRSRSFVEEAP